MVSAAVRQLCCSTLFTITSGSSLASAFNANGFSAVQARSMPSHLPNKSVSMLSGLHQAPLVRSPLQRHHAYCHASALSWGDRVPRTLRDLLRCTNGECVPHRNEHSTWLHAVCPLSLILSALRTSTQRILAHCCHNAC